MRLVPLMPFLGLLASCVSAQQTSIKLSTDRPGNLFPAGAEVTVAVSAEGVSEAEWKLTNFDQEVVASDKVTLVDGKAVLRLGPLPRGYFELTCTGEAASAKLALGVVADHSTVAPTDSRLNVDGAISWLSRREDFEELAQMLRIAGVGWVRERFSWGQTEPQKGTVDWRQYDASADAYAKAGVRVYQIFHDSPGWTHPDNKATRNPADLRDVYTFTKRVAEHYKGRVGAWEVWNEPDIGFWPDLGDTFAGVQKAAYLGFKAGDPELPVLMASFCRGVCSFDENLLESGIKDYFDIFNWHIYAAPETYPGTLGKYLELLRKYGCADRPVWLSEAGIRLVATEPGGELNPADERKQAEFVPKSFAYTLAAGTDKHFFFVYPYYLENGVQFGALRKDLSPRPGFIAIAAAADLLGEAKYLGQYKLADATALAFDSGRGNVLVVWGAKPQTVELAAPKGAAVADLFGRQKASAVDGKLKVEVGPTPQYVLGLDDSIRGNLSGAVRPEGRLPANTPCPVIVRGQAQVAQIDKNRNCYLVAGEPFKYTVEVCNLTEAGGANGEVSLEVPEGWTCEPKSAPISLEPMGRAVVEFALSGAPPSRAAQKVWVRPSFPGVQGTVQPSVSYFALDVSRVKPRETLDLKLDDPKAWTLNISGNGTMEIVAGAEGGICANIKFPGPGDRWCYPLVRFDPPRDLSAYDGVAFEYRCHGDDDKTMVRLQVDEADGPSYLGDAGRAKKDWTTVQMCFADLTWGGYSKPDPNGKLDLDAIGTIKIGLNTPKDEARLEIRNVRLVKF